MTPRSNTLFPLALVIGLALLTFWLEHAVQPSGDGTSEAARHDPDFVVENFTATNMNKAGKPVSTLTARRMVHFPDDDSTELDLPRLVQTQENGPPVHISADRGNVTKDGEEIRLYGNVIVRREATPERPEMRMDTTYLQVFPDTEIARTPERVVITEGKSRLVGVGMEVSNKTRVFELKSKVSGTYVQPED